jgi:GT2 family glycosyltransferase
VIGYYGAISDWFDSEVVADLAERRPDWDFVLVGSTFGADLSRLGKMPNVTLAGEKPYAEIPSWLAGFDVAFIPFRRIPLTEATNPVKAYEIFAAGKPLVAVPLPEIAAMAPHVRLAATPADFESEIDSALSEKPGDRPAADRRAFAAANTWEKRFETLAPAVAAAFPRVSVVIVTYNNLALNRLCLESVFGRTEWPNLEVFAVDNASADGTPEYLRQAEKRWKNLRVIGNAKNWGFATANNQGVRESTGRYLVLLNNDTVVSRGWATALVRHLARDPKLGLVGPMTNEIGNEAKVEVGYRTLAEMPAWAGEWVRAHDGESFPLPMLAMFCVALRRDTLEKVGLLDERFGVGMFEDDDYTRRLRMAGYDIRCARDAFVHHAGRASFKLLGDKRPRQPPRPVLKERLTTAQKSGLLTCGNKPRDRSKIAFDWVVSDRARALLWPPLR